MADRISKTNVSTPEKSFEVCIDTEEELGQDDDYTTTDMIEWSGNLADLDSGFKNAVEQAAVLSSQDNKTRRVRLVNVLKQVVISQR